MTAATQLFNGSSDPIPAIEIVNESAGRGATSWIQPPIVRPVFHAMPRAQLQSLGSYVVVDSTRAVDAVRNEMAQWRLSAAAGFWGFEDALPEEEG